MKSFNAFGLIEQREALRDLLAFPCRKDRGRKLRAFRGQRESANLIIDVRNTADYDLSILQGSGANLIVGRIIDMLQADTYTNVWVAGGAGSGAIQVRVQTADVTTSGDFTDPTSGMTDFPVGMTSGTILTANSGIWSSGNTSMSSPTSGVLFQSGGMNWGAFLRPHRYARLIQVSSIFPDVVLAGFLGQKRTTGPGGGYSWSPAGSGGVVNV